MAIHYSSRTFSILNSINVFMYFWVFFGRGGILQAGVIPLCYTFTYLTQLERSACFSCLEEEMCENSSPPFNVEEVRDV